MVVVVVASTRPVTLALQSPMDTIKRLKHAADVDHVLLELSPLKSPKLYTSFIKAYGRAGEPLKGLALLDKMRENGVEPNAITYTAAISACGRGGRWKEALALFDEMRRRDGAEPNSITYTAAIFACKNGGQWEKALEFLDEMRQRGLEASVATYNAVISSCGKHGRWEKALAMLDEMRRTSGSLEPDAFTYNAVISACAKSNQWEKAIGLLGEMRGAGVEPDVIAYNAAISACKTEWEKALALLDDMRESGLEPDVVTYSTAISACEKGNQWERALALLDDMREREIEPSVVTYSAAISACGKGNQWEKALLLLDNMRERGVKPNVITYSAAITACTRGGQWEKALALLDEMLDRGLSPNVVTYSAAISACEKGNQLGKALALLEKLRALEPPPDVMSYASAISACGKANRWKNALELLDEMRARGVRPTVTTYSAAISACGRGNQWRKARELFDEMRREGIEPNSITYTAVISACEKGKRWETALELLDEMREQRGIEPSVITYNAAITACGEGGQWEKALALLDEMRRRDRRLEPDVITYSAVMSACEKSNQWEKAITLLDEMQHHGVAPDVIAYNAAIAACKRGREWNKALSLLDEMRRRGLEPDVISYSATISACEKGGQWEKALALLDEMRQRGLEPDVITYNAAISACELAGALDAAESTVLRALDDGLYSQCWNSESRELDLRMMSVPVARTVVRLAIADARRGSDQRPRYFDNQSAGKMMLIITGHGKNSESGVAVVRRAIIDLLADYVVDTETHMVMDELVAVVRLLGTPTHPEHGRARAQLEAWEASRAGELCVALARMVCEGLGLDEAARQLAAIALKNVARRRWQALDAATVQAVREAALRSLGDRNELVRSGGAALVEATFAGWDAEAVVPALRTLCEGDDASVDGALRAIAALGAALNGDDVEVRRGKRSSASTTTSTWPLGAAEGPRLVAAVARLLEHRAASVRRRALRCARLVQWLEREALGVVAARLGALAADRDAGVREEVLVALRALLPRLGGESLEGVAEHALRSLSDPDAGVVLRAAEWWHAVARRRARTRLLPRLVPALLRAMRYTVDDVSDFSAGLAGMSVAVADRPEDVEPRRPDERDDDWDDDWDDDDDDDEVDNDPVEGGEWTLRKCAAATLDALARDTEGLLEIVLPRIAAALAGEPSDDTERGPEGGSAPADSPPGVWEREAALLALGAVSSGCAAGLRPLAASVAPFVIAQLQDPQPKIREIAAWVASRGAAAWFPENDDSLLAAYVDALMTVLCVDDHKRVLESAATAARSLFSGVAAPGMVPRARRAAASLATAVGRLQLRARLVAYDAAATLASRVGLDEDGRLALLGALDARWAEDCALDGDPALALLECLKAVAATDPGGRASVFYDRAITRCVALVDHSVATLADPGADLEDVRLAAGVGTYALDVVATICGPLGADRAADALAWATLEAALAVDATVTSLRDPTQRRREPDSLRWTHKLALASAAAMLLGELACVAPNRLATDLARNPPVGIALLACVAVPLDVARATPAPLDVARATPALVSAAAMVSQNAAWVVGDLALRADPDACRRLLSFFADTAKSLVALVARDDASNGAVALSAAMMLGRLASRHELLDAVAPPLCAHLALWLRALAAVGQGIDTNDLSRCFSALCAIASRDLDALADPSVATALVVALAAWRRCDPPTPPPTLALTLKRLLRALRERRALQFLESNGGSASCLHPDDAEYLARLYG
ncbi:hypothetical protein CTAYLR_006898 [Chrysophaeum taylorii]|uniref:Importin N-terminal domain-containing protein n=1 Tax=Chrysophaeum taylorii TaxID=2483200 RepID=A0AAD7UIB4_9STRA|nr:hypothetical protein CTAYLR_006898 [Chrysophaeum taylorii]